MQNTKIVFNKTIRIITSDWDSKALESISSGEGFRITEEGKSDTNTEAGMYSIHSPLYGTDYNDEHAFEDRYSCRCGRYIGKNFENYLCPECKTRVQFIDVDMTKTGWIILDKDVIINPSYFNKLKSFIGKKFFPDIIKYKELHERSEDIPFDGIGLIEFHDRFDEILDYFYKKYASNQKKQQHYFFIKVHQYQVFAHAIPVYSSHLRPFVVKADEIKYSDEDKLYKRIFTNHLLLNDKYELDRRHTEAVKRKRKSAQYLRREHLIYAIQSDLDSLWELTFDQIKKKSGTIRSKVLGGRLDFTARNVIVPDKDLKPNQIKLGYTTFLNLYKLEIISILIKMYDIPHSKAWELWDAATINFDERIYKIMEYMVNHRDIYCEINRNPTIDYGSELVMQVIYVYPDINDNTMALPELILTPLNADFDGDVLNVMSLKIDSVKKEYFEKLNPMFNMFISRNDGKYNMKTSIYKDMSIGLYTFANI